MRRKLCIIILLSLVSCGCLTGCSQAKNLIGTNKGAAVRTETSDVISIPMEKVRTLNPVIAKDEGAYYLDKLIYQGLFELDETLVPRGQLADSYEYSEDGRTVTITLKNGVKWQDGSTFSAEDVVFSINAYQSVYNAALKSVYEPYISLIKSAKVIDDDQVTITFKDPKNAAVENLTFPIIPADTAKKAAMVQKLTDSFEPVGTGPYSASTSASGNLITLTGNPEYQGSIPRNKILAKYIPNKEDAVNLFEIREYNMTYLQEGDRDALLSDIDGKVYSFPSNEVEFIGFNFRNETLKDMRVRQAITYALDAKKIIDGCYFGNGIMNDTVYFPDYLGVSSERPLNEYKPEKAIELMKRAGYKDVSLRLLVNSGNSERVLAANEIKEELKAAGIAVEVVSVPAPEFESKVASGNFDLYLGGYKIKDTYDLRPMLRTGYGNSIGYTNPRLDTFLDQMQSGITVSKKKAVFKKIRTILREEVPYYCLLYKTYGIAASNDLNGDVLPRFDNIYNGCDTWNLTYKIPEDAAAN
jgi:peptide/nickel transport system substrate-binding protein